MPAVAMSSTVLMGLLAIAALHGRVFAVLTGMTQPSGFATTEYFSGDVPGARSIAISGGASQSGQGPIVYVASSDEGKVSRASGAACIPGLMQVTV